MKSLRNGTDVMGVPIDRDTRRARLLAARRKPVGSLNRKGILSGHWDARNLVEAFRNGRGSFISKAATTTD